MDDETGVAGHTAKRPTGQVLLIIAAWASLAGAAALMGGFFSPRSEDAHRILYFVLAGALLNLALFTGIAGIIVRAIWFLPGDEQKSLASSFFPGASGI